MALIRKGQNSIIIWSECGWVVTNVLLMCLVISSDSFNIDTVNFIRHSGTPGSMFGFSVAEHRERGKNWVLIGAPEAQTRQPGVTKGGAVYRCETSRDDACEEILFDSTGNNNNTDGRQIDKKSNQWFGATVRSSGETGIVLACAPRYVWFSTTTAYRRDPVGTCYIAKNYFSEFSEYSPCRTRNWGYHRQGSCQAGLGADVSKDGNRLYVGAPGSWYWQGQIYDINPTFKMPTISPDYSKNHELNLIEYESGNKDGRKITGSLVNKNNHHNQSNQHGGGQLYAQNPNKRPEVLATSEGSPQDDDSYLGYSVAAGDFEGRGEGGVAVGMPRGAGLFGKVVLYSVNLTNLQNLTGHQLGSYFSYSLAAVDVDGDGLDDVIVGAPLYTDLNNNEGKYETGRVYIYYQEPRIDSEGYYTRFGRYDFRDGKNSKARFGLSVASLGDTNKDGFGDFAVGAPYDGPEGRGAVYIYNGKRGGVRETYSQVIRAEDLSVPTSTFGFSVAGGLDMDDNQYPDMVVGAYDSDTAIFFRSRPVVRMVDARVSFNSKTKQISLEEENCTLRDYTKVPCLYLQACLKYDGVEVERQLDVDIGVTLDSKKPKTPRMFFLNEEGKSVKNDTVRLTKGELNCKSYYVYVKPNIRDKLTPLEAELRYNVKDESKSQVGLGRRYTRSLTPVLDAGYANVQKDSLSIQKNCGPDNICIPDLQVITKKSVSKYLLGSGERFSLDVQVENRGEDAFEAMYNLQVPPGMNYINIERLDSDRSIPVQCSAPSPLTNNTLKCDIGNPLPKEKLVHFKVLLQPFHREGMKSSYNFVSAVNSTNPEDEFTTRDNVESFTIPIWVETDLILQGSAHPPDIHYNMSHYDGEIQHEVDIGPQVLHVYNIRNKGPSDILEAQAIFLWPSYTMSDEHLLYLLEQPETSGNVKCEYVENVNEERIELDRKRKSFLDSAAFSAVKQGGHGKAGGRVSGEGVRGRGGAGGAGGQGRGGAAGASGTAWGRGKAGGRGESAWGRGGMSSGGSGNAGGAAYTGSGGSAWGREGAAVGASTQGGRSSWSGQGGRWEGISWENLSEEERRQLEEEIRRGGGVDFDSGDGSLLHRTRVHGQATASGGKHESGGNTDISSGRGGGRVISSSSGRGGGRVISSSRGSGIYGGSRGSDEIRSSGTGGLGGGVSTAGSNSASGASTGIGIVTHVESENGVRSGSGTISWSEENGRVSSSSSKGGTGSTHKLPSSESKNEDSYRITTGSQGKHFQWGHGQSGGEASGEGKVRIQDEKRIQQKPLVFNATGYSRARGKVEGDLNKNFTDSSGAFKKAFGQNEFRTVTLDLTPGHDSNLGINIIGGGTIENEIGGSRSGSQYGASVTHGTDVSQGTVSRTREYEDAINRELERRRQEAEEAAAAAAAAAAGLVVDGNKIESNGSLTTEGTRVWSGKGGGSSHGGARFDDRQQSGSGRTDGLSREGAVRTYTSTSRANKIFHTQDSHSTAGDLTHGGGFRSYEEDMYNRENERRRLEAQAAATGASGVDRTSGGTRKYQIHGSMHGNGTRTYKILHNGTKVYETRYDSDGQGGESRNYEYEDALNREYEKRRQEAEAAAAAAASSSASPAGISGTSRGGAHGTYTQGGSIQTYAGMDLRAHEESLRREYEIKRQEAEAAARELERIRLESEAGGPASNNPRMHETVEALRREYERKRLEAEAAAAAAAAAAEARSAVSSSHQYSNEYHYRTNSSWGSEGRPWAESSNYWTFDNNGTVHGGSSGYDADYLRQLQEHEKRLREEAARRLQDERQRGSSVQQYFNTSYFSSGQRAHDSSRDRNVDPDLGYVRLTEESGSRYSRKAVASHLENFVETDDLKKSYERSMKHPMLLTRYKRQVGTNKLDLKSSLSCGPTKCTKIKCTVGPLTRGQEAWVAFRGRVWVDTLKKIGYEREIMLSSLLASQVTKLPHIGEPHNAKVETYEVFSEMMPQDVTVKPEVAPLWVIVLSACAGTLILLLLAFLLWKLGFFKRNRPSNAPEKQPLNRNGYHSGDEQL